MVFMAVSSLGFLAFVAAIISGGPDWYGEMRSPDLHKEFAFSIEQGPRPTYSARLRRTEAPVAEKTTVPAEVVLKTRKKLEEELNRRIQELNSQPAKLQDSIKETVSTIVADKKGVEAREQFFRNHYDEIWKQVQAVGDEFTAATIQTQDVLRQSQERREEAYRLANQLDLIRNDQFSAQEQQQALQNELIRLQEYGRRLERRQKQLKTQLGESD